MARTPRDRYADRIARKTLTKDNAKARKAAERGPSRGGHRDKQAPGRKRPGRLKPKSKDAKALLRLLRARDAAVAAVVREFAKAKELLTARSAHYRAAEARALALFTAWLAERLAAPLPGETWPEALGHEAEHLLHALRSRALIAPD